MSYLLALISGIALGTLGGGGSILIVPILIYVIGLAPKLAIILSLGIVGISSAFTVIANRRTINYKLAFQFIPFSLIGTFLGSYTSQFISSTIQLVIFSIIMLVASRSMLKKKTKKEATYSLSSFGIKAFIVGVITGLIGVGGGFLIVPTLLNFANQDIKRSISTSLFIIMLNSLGGFTQHLLSTEVPWKFLLIFTLLTTVGALVGTKINKRMNPDNLRKYFAYFLVLMSLFILSKEVIIS